MISLQEIQKQIQEMRFNLEEPGLIVMNEADFLDLESHVIIPSGNPKHMFGIKLAIIPLFLLDERFLKLGTALIINKKYTDFLKELFK